MNGLRINDIILGWENPKSNFTNGIEIENFENILITNYNVSAAFEKKSLYDIKLSKGENYKLVNDLSLSQKPKFCTLIHFNYPIILMIWADHNLNQTFEEGSLVFL